MQRKQFQNKVTWFAFLFSVLVIWSHSYNAELFLGKTAIAAQVNQLERVLGDTVSQIAVPGFFMISGFLFYQDLDFRGIPGKWESRFYSIVVPYAVWNLIYYIGYLLSGAIPWLNRITGTGMVRFGPVIVLDAVINHTYHYVFWYLKQLILLVALAPLIYWFANRGRLVLLALGGLWYLINQQIRIPLLNLDALFYYLIAACAGLNAGRWVRAEQQDKKKAMTGIAFLSVGVLCFFVYLKLDQVGYLVLFRAFVPMACWLGIPAERLQIVRPWMSVNFFLYAVHFALVRLINKSLALLLPEVPVLPLLLYFCMPVIVISVVYLAAVKTQTYFPAVWKLLTGFRYR